MRNPIVRLRDFVENAATWLWDAWTYALLWVVRAHANWTWIRDDKKSFPEAPSAKGVPETQARFLFEDANEASNHTDGKVGQLLTLTAGLFSFYVLFSDSSDTALERVLSLGGFFSLFAAMLLCLKVLGRPNSMKPEPGTDDGEFWDDLAYSAQYNQHQHFRRLDVYIGARRWFVLGLLAFLVLTFLGSRSGDSEPSSARGGPAATAERDCPP